MSSRFQIIFFVGRIETSDSTHVYAYGQYTASSMSQMRGVQILANNLVNSVPTGCLSEC